LNQLVQFAAISAFILAVIAVVTWRHFRSYNKSARDRRRKVLLMGGAYAVTTIAVVCSEVAHGTQPKLTLIGLPIPILIVWYFWKRANRATPSAVLDTQKEKGPEARASEPPGQKV
jgi:hypothetical protein